MNNRRLLFLLLVGQLLNLLLLTQNWYSISMNLNGTVTNLGEFDATATYALAMPATLLSGATTLVALLVAGLSKRVIIALGAAVTSSLALWLGIQVVLRNVAGLDAQLDRLTGIAKTHGIDSLQIAVTVTPWIWLGISVLLVALGVYLALNSKGWQVKVEQPLRRQSVAKATSTIDLWEQQRD